jgi:multidrug transporter EmrE-like cation transporter
MRTRKKSLLDFLALAVAALAAALIMRNSVNGPMRVYAKFIGYGAVALVLIGRLFFGGTAEPTPPMPKD